MGNLAAIIYHAAAQGSAFTYQGRLNLGGIPVTGNYDVAFSLYSTNVGGYILTSGPITNAATPVSGGLFTVTLDFGSAAFAGPSNWLEISVRSNGVSGFTILSPRQLLTATPYAITAGGLSGTLPVGQLNGILSTSQLPASVLTDSARRNRQPDCGLTIVSSDWRCNGIEYRERRKRRECGISIANTK